MSGNGYERTFRGLPTRVRFAPNSGHPRQAFECPLLTLSGHSVEYAVQQVGAENQWFPYPLRPLTSLCSLACVMAESRSARTYPSSSPHSLARHFEFAVWNTAAVIAGEFRFNPVKEVHLQLTFVFGLDAAPVFGVE